MSLDKLLSKIIVLGSLSLFNYSCESSSPEPTSCSKDTDCKGDRICDGNTKMCVETTSTATSSSKYNTCSEGVIYTVKNCCLYYKNISDKTPSCCTNSNYIECRDEFADEFLGICEKKGIKESYNFLNCISPSCPFSGASSQSELDNINSCIKKYSAL